MPSLGHVWERDLGAIGAMALRSHVWNEFWPANVKYSIGNVIGLVSSGFLVGFSEQLAQMSSPVRIGATCAYLASIIATVIAAMVFQHPLLTMGAMVVQFLALAWYCASYIPFGRMCIRQCVGKWCCPV